MPDNVIVLVEDSEDDRELISRLFKKFGIATRLVVLKDGAEALDYLFSTGAYAGREDSITSVVLLDLKMPRLSGFDVLERVRHDERTRFTPVVILTSSSQEEDIARSYSLGANSYIRKEISYDKYSATIGQLGTYWGVHNQISNAVNGEPVLEEHASVA